VCVLLTAVQFPKYSLYECLWLQIKNSVLCDANVVPGSPILATLMMVTILSSETWVLTRATRRKTSEDGVLHSHRRENLKSYITLTGWTL
jgi:hypothetical protein